MTASEGRAPTTRTLDRGLQVLETIARGDGQTLGEVAAATDLSPATVLRLLGTLRARGFVVRIGDSYRIGVRTFEVGARFLAHTRLQEVSRPVLMRLAEEASLNASLAILDGADAIVVDGAEGRRNFGSTARIGRRASAHASASGKVLLAWLWEGRLAQILGDGPLPSVTRHTVTDRDALFRELAEARRTGIARDDEEFEIGISCRAAPIRDRHGQVLAAIGVTGTVGQIAEVEGPAAEMVREAGEDISARMGWRSERGSASLVD